jgi:hypothetical protein
VIRLAFKALGLLPVLVSGLHRFDIAVPDGWPGIPIGFIPRCPTRDET